MCNEKYICHKENHNKYAFKVRMSFKIKLSTNGKNNGNNYNMFKA